VNPFIQVIAKSQSSGPIVRYQSCAPTPDTEGDIDALSLWAGQSVGLVSRRQSAGEIVAEIAAEAQLILRRSAQ
jgi:nitronate monooxygenase